jgi:UDPglucose 6-dehydrogenase
MKVVVYGLWHLGCVTAACVAAAGNEVIGLDLDEPLIDALRAGKPPIQEPGLNELIAGQLQAGHLSFTTAPNEALQDAQILWITFDTPVNERDEADVEFVSDRLRHIAPYLHRQTIVLISSQVPVGFTREMQKRLPTPLIAYSPENLRLGKAIEVFNHPERVILGVSDASIKPKLAALFAPFTDRIEWMSLESAEMTKHAINAFLATSVTFANELARLCEAVGADAKEVERGLKSEGRIGPKAYLAPGGAFAGGTLARDLRFLTQFGRQHGVDTSLFNGVIASNDHHKNWTRDKVRQMLQGINSPTVAVLGLTYKPGTDTLRRSASVELCRWMHEQGYQIRAHDPAVRELPMDLQPVMTLYAEVPLALAGADLAILATEWPEYRSLGAKDFTGPMRRAALIDPNWFLAGAMRESGELRYVTTGRDSGGLAGNV